MRWGTGVLGVSSFAWTIFSICSSTEGNRENRVHSFKPGEISPEEANRLGYELAMKFTRGKHQFVVSTHVDRAHVHTHIEFNSTNLDCDGKFQNVKDSALILRRLNSLV